MVYLVANLLHIVLVKAKAIFHEVSRNRYQLGKYLGLTLTNTIEQWILKLIRITVEMWNITMKWGSVLVQDIFTNASLLHVGVLHDFNDLISRSSLSELAVLVDVVLCTPGL